jgi:hypothetical protein
MANPRDRWHDEALGLSRTLACRVVLTEYIVLELGNALSKGSEKKVFLSMVASFRSNPQVEVVPASRELLAKGLRMFAKHMDKDWSLTDCISFVAMRERGIQEALTFDAHFRQAGFRMLP